MTKSEFIKAIENMPDNAPIKFWDFNHDCWLDARPFLMNNEHIYDYDEKGNNIDYTFIGIE